jgi:hypothetical protein
MQGTKRYMLNTAVLRATPYKLTSEGDSRRQYVGEQASCWTIIWGGSGPAEVKVTAVNDGACVVWSWPDTKTTLIDSVSDCYWEGSGQWTKAGVFSLYSASILSHRCTMGLFTVLRNQNKACTKYQFPQTDVHHFGTRQKPTDCHKRKLSRQVVLPLMSSSFDAMA